MDEQISLLSKKVFSLPRVTTTEHQNSFFLRGHQNHHTSRT